MVILETRGSSFCSKWTMLSSDLTVERYTEKQEVALFQTRFVKAGQMSLLLTNKAPRGAVPWANAIDSRDVNGSFRLL